MHRKVQAPFQAFLCSVSRRRAPFDKGDKAHSPIYPYNAYLHPSLISREILPLTLLCFRLVSSTSVFPPLCQPALTTTRSPQRNRSTDTRAEWRMHELKNMLAMMGEGGLRFPSLGLPLTTKLRKSSIHRLPQKEDGHTGSGTSGVADMLDERTNHSTQILSLLWRLP